MPRSITNRKMVLISVHVPKKLLDAIDELIYQGLIPNRSEAIRMALILFLERALPKQSLEKPQKEDIDPEKEAFRTLVLKGR